MAATSLAAHVGVAPACRALGVSRATWYRRRRPAPGRQQPRKRPARALDEAERERVLDVLACPRFVDRSPGEVVATLLDEGQYLCSERTMYRILAAEQPVRERRNQLAHPHYAKPELVATAPNQTWSWDITRLLGPKRWTYFYLYVVLDIFSRYVVGWMVAERESAALATRLIEQTCLKQGIAPQVLTLHSDRGAPMTSKCTAQLLADLGVTRSLSRPQVSDDNPFSEAQFKTLKYHPGFPGTLRRPHRRDRVLPVLLPLVQHRAPSWRHRNAYPRGRPSRPRPAHSRASPTHPSPGVVAAPRTIRARNPKTPPSPTRGLDQPTGPRDVIVACSVNADLRCLNVVDRFRIRCRPLAQHD